MRRVCAWCSATLIEDGEEAVPISHGICEPCAGRMLSETRASVREFLEGLVAPVFLVDGGGRIHAANGGARALVGKSNADIEDRLGGDVIECANARLPGGCGKTVHCQACTIRNSVTETLATGTPRLNVPATQDVYTDRGVAQKRFLVSTERAGSMVLLRVEEDHAANLITEV